MASQRQQRSRSSLSDADGRARSESWSTSGVLTPFSSHGDSAPSLNGQSDSALRDRPIASIERGIETLGIDSVNVTISPPPVHGNSTPSVNDHFADLDLGRGASASAGGRASLSPGPEDSSPPHSRSRRRSSSRKIVQRHEVDQEKLPDSKFYSPGFQVALTQSKDLAKQFADTLSSCNLHTDESSAIHSLHNQARDASRYCGTNNWKIGFVGDSGAGKSSLINSLLDSKGLARTSNSGAACTCTVTEYHYHDSPAYAIEVVYFTKDRLMQQFKEHLQVYRRFHLHPTDDAAERKDLEEASSVAWHALKAAFRNQPLLTEAYLRQRDEETLLDTILSWMDDSAPPGYHQADILPNMRRESVADERACSELLEQMTSGPSDASTATVWPYIERVKYQLRTACHVDLLISRSVFLRASILSKGLILVDLPGLHDTNSARRMITERYVVKCDEIFAIASIGRATTDAGVKAVIDLAKRTRRKYVGIVCSKSDDIKGEEAERDWTGPALHSLRLLKRNVMACEESLQRIAGELEDELDSDEELDLHRERRDVEEKQRNHEYRLQRHMVTTRNNQVVVELRRIYSPTVQSVFCVSNTFYWERRNEDRDVALPWLQLSGIISLRRHCLGLVAEHQLQDASIFMKGLIPTLVTSINLWIQSGSGQIAAETRTQVRKASKEVEHILQNELMSHFSPSNKILSALPREFEIWVRSHFTNENDEGWRGIACDAAKEWSTWHHGSYGAFCRKYGDHFTHAAGTHCWNEEIIEGMTGDLTEPWKRFLRLAKDSFQRHSDAVEVSFEQALNPLQSIDLAVNDRDNFDSLQTLISTVKQRKTLLRIETLAVATEYGRGLTQLGNVDFLSGIRTSFIGQHLETAYCDARQDSGTGVDTRRKALIQGKVNDPTLFDDIQVKLEAQFQTLTLDSEHKVHDANKKHFLAVREALDTLRNENVALEAERNPDFRERLRMQVVDAQHPLEDIAAAIRVVEQGTSAA